MYGLQKEKTFSFIGYSRNKSFDAEKFKKNIAVVIDTLYDKGYRNFMISPFSLVEGIAMEELIKKKSIFPDIKLIVLKNDNVHNNWSRLYGCCDELVDIDRHASSDTGDLQHDNYDYLIDNTSLLVCYIDCKPKKRSFALEKAIAQNMEIINVFSPIP